MYLCVHCVHAVLEIKEEDTDYMAGQASADQMSGKIHAGLQHICVYIHIGIYVYKELHEWVHV